ncbi:MAG: hypothetical protein Q4F85_07185 [Prevotella sp.]|nr:hypothetical protein [Prevotella sp.]
MGRTKFSQHEIDIIGMLLRRKNAGTRFQQKMIRHQLRVNFEFNISDFNVQGKAFGEEELHAAINRGAIQILDDATIAAMKAKRAADRAKDAMKMAADESADTDNAMAAAMATWTDEQWEEFAKKQNENK